MEIGRGKTEEEEPHLRRLPLLPPPPPRPPLPPPPLLLLLLLLLLLRSTSRRSNPSFSRARAICRQMPASNFTEFEKYAPQTLKHLFLSNERNLRCRPPQAAPTLPTFVRLNFHPAEVQATPSNYGEGEDIKILQLLLWRGRCHQNIMIMISINVLFFA